MKKIITVLMVVFTMVSMFAYIPNKKNVKKHGEYVVYNYKYKDIYGKKKTSYITYNTKTEEIYFSPYENLEFIKEKYSPYENLEFIKEKYSSSLKEILIKDIERMWSDADEERESYRIFIDAAEFNKKFCKEYCKEDCKKDPCCEDKAKEDLSIAKEIEKQFLDEYPFFTKENWLTLTKEEWNKMAKDFLENN